MVADLSGCSLLSNNLRYKYALFTGLYGDLSVVATLEDLTLEFETLIVLSAEIKSCCASALYLLDETSGADELGSFPWCLLDSNFDSTCEFSPMIITGTARLGFRDLLGDSVLFLSDVAGLAVPGAFSGPLTTLDFGGPALLLPELDLTKLGVSFGFLVGSEFARGFLRL